ncbi:UbiA family prenyltransferase [Alsobacter metallidurans]|uniref:UbiA family prenyltransferase n=1 Tax=Alsobacter metallidurans TaxID=340221 RepID=UPI0016658AF3|nr:UbiA family prenyltransferase [Alsobacter metallidurans]
MAGSITDRQYDRQLGANAGATVADVPLVVDVDGTLIKSDILHESALQFVARYPYQIWKLPVWLRTQGKSGLKTELAKVADPVVASIPIRDETLTLIREAQSAGRRVYLASASERSMVEALADRIGGVTGVFATESTVNLAGDAKAERLIAEFGRGGFDYVGDAKVDFPVWQASRRVLAVSHKRGFEAKLMSAFPDAQVIARPTASLADMARALRPHQWAKNSLVFVALLAGHHFTASAIFASVLAFICFSMAASSAYLINDLLDLPGDRAHSRKRYRPFASGSTPIMHGIVAAVALGCGAFALATALPWKFRFILLLYVITTLGYSLLLKRKLVIDVVALGGLYALRVLGGMTALGLAQSPWLLMFSLFLFSSLAIVKRCSELTANKREAHGRLIGRGYQVRDLRVLFPCAAAAGYGSVLVFSLYLSSPEMRGLYSHPDRLWLVCPLLIYWISRVLILSNRDEMHDDPVVFALTDRNSLLTGCCVLAVLAISI